MFGKFNYLRNKIQDFVLRGQAFAPVTPLYMGLLTCTNGEIARSTTYAVGNTAVIQTSDDTYHLYAVTAQTGATAAAAPAFPGVENEVITDGGVTWTEQSAGLRAGTAAVEPAGGAYARASVASTMTEWSGTQGAGTTVASTGTTGQISNNVAIPFPTSTAAWAASPAMIWGFALWDAASAGNGYYFGPLATPQNVGSGVTPSFANGTLTVTEK